MNATDDTGGFLNSGNMGGFTYGIGVSVGILLLITTITLASYFCARVQPPPQLQHPPGWVYSGASRHGVDSGGGGAVAISIPAPPERGEATIMNCPKLLYSEAKLRSKDSTATCCSICLADYKSNDVLRLLPDCGHVFHHRCVDTWLRLNPTCPVCRTSPLPTPQSTPLSEVMPRAG